MVITIFTGLMKMVKFYTIKENLKKKLINIWETETDSGWIAPNGKFYECGTEQHTSLADWLLEDKFENNEHELEERGWVKLSSSEIRFKGSRYGDRKGVFTKRQKRTIINYFKENNKRINIFQSYYSVDEFDMKYEAL